MGFNSTFKGLTFIVHNLNFRSRYLCLSLNETHKRNSYTRCCYLINQAQIVKSVAVSGYYPCSLKHSLVSYRSIGVTALKNESKYTQKKFWENSDAHISNDVYGEVILNHQRALITLLNHTLLKITPTSGSTDLHYIKLRHHRIMVSRLRVGVISEATARRIGRIFCLHLHFLSTSLKQQTFPRRW